MNHCFSNDIKSYIFISLRKKLTLHVISRYNHKLSNNSYVFLRWIYSLDVKMLDYSGVQTRDDFSVHYIHVFNITFKDIWGLRCSHVAIFILLNVLNMLSKRTWLKIRKRSYNNNGVIVSSRNNNKKVLCSFIRNR